MVPSSPGPFVLLLTKGGHPQREGTNLSVSLPVCGQCPAVRVQIWMCLICVILTCSNGAVQIQEGLELAESWTTELAESWTTKCLQIASHPPKPPKEHFRLYGNVEECIVLWRDLQGQVVGGQTRVDLATLAFFPVFSKVFWARKRRKSH